MEEIIKQLDNKVVFIESKEMLEEARALIEAKGFGIGETFFLSDDKKLNYLYLDYGDDTFGLAVKLDRDTEITFENFKTIMK